MNDLISTFGTSLDYLVTFFTFTWPVFLPALLVFGFWKVWVAQLRFAFINKTKTTLLEIKIPKDVKRTPLAMEILMNALYQGGGESTWYDRYVLGKIRSWFSLEIASIGGHVHFFIWTHEKWKNLIEAQLYAEYPGVEVFEVEDYASRVPFDESKMSYWGCEFVLTKDDHVPLKTYIDYGMDKQVGLKDEDRFDPLVPTLEFMSTLSEKEQFWIQIVVRVHKGRKKKGAFFSWQTEKWPESGKEFIKEKAVMVTAEDGAARVGTNKSDQVLVEAVDRKISKYGFDTGVRALYMGENDAFNGANIPGFIGSYRQFGANNLNSFKPNNVTDFDFPWTKVLKKKKLSSMKEEMLEAYKLRQFFHAPYIRDHQVLNTEELATLYHFPPGTVEMPNFERISSRKAEPPTNLPI